MSQALTTLSLPELRRVLEAVERGDLSCPLDASELRASWSAAIANALVAAAGGLDAAGVAACLRVAIAERESRKGPRLDLVWTGPEARVATARDTAVIVAQLFERARIHVLIAGFSFDHGASIFAPLHRAMQAHGVRTEIFLDIPGEAATVEGVDAFARDHAHKFLSENWPATPPFPAIYYDPRTARPDVYASLHAKCIVVDAQHTLVTSANFTSRAQTRNIELGVLIDDAPFAERVLEQWRGLVDARLVVPAV